MSESHDSDVAGGLVGVLARWGLIAVAADSGGAGAWRDDAACAHEDPDLFQPRSSRPGPAEPAKRICAGCPVRVACLEDALTREEGLSVRYRSGVWGGLSVSERVDVSAQREQREQQQRRRRAPLRTCARCPREVRGPRARYCAGCALDVKRENDRLAVAARRANARARAS